MFVVLTLNKKPLLRIPFNLIIFCPILFTLGIQNSSAQENYQFDEIEINASTKSDEDSGLDFTSNPFELVEMIRRANSMNDATSPSDAIDDAIKSFDMIKTNNDK